MKAFAVLALGFLPLVFVGCSSTHVKTYDDGGATYIGRGGAKETVDGVEIWTEGAPPRPYQILAVIEDERPKAIVPMARFNGMLVEKTKAAGGDAVIVRRKGSYEAGTLYIPGSTTTNYSGTAHATGAGNYQMSGTATSSSMPGYAVRARRQEAVIDIVKYVDAPAPVPTPVTSAAPRDENGITAATYLQLAEKYDGEGNAEMAKLARQKAARLQ